MKALFIIGAFAFAGYVSLKDGGIDNGTAAGTATADQIGITTNACANCLATTPTYTTQHHPLALYRN